jgi:hypothetical protein
MFKVAMLANYLGLVHNAAMCCGLDTTSEPLPSLDFLRRLFRHLLRARRLHNAFSVAQKYASRAVRAKATLLLEELFDVLGSIRLRKHGDLDDDALNNVLLEADVACEIVDWIKNGNRSKECRSKLDFAAQLYRRAGHSYGVFMVKLYFVNLRISKSAKQRQRQQDEVQIIKEQFQQLRYLEGVRQALAILHELAQANRDLELVVALETKMRENGRVRGNPLDGLLQSHLSITYWSLSSSVSAQMLQTCEELYRGVKDAEVPMVRLLLAKGLADGYKKVGDLTSAAHWRSLVQLEPVMVPKGKRFLLGQDPFFNALREQTSPPDDDESELIELRQELKRIEQYIDPDSVPPKDLHFGIMKVTQMMDHYVMQVGFRGLDACETRVKTCLGSCERLIDVLPESEKLHWRAQIVQTHARLLFNRALRLPPDQVLVPANRDGLWEATRGYEKALAMLQKARSSFEVAMVLQDLHSCYQYLRRISTAYTDTAHVTSTAARQPTHTTRTQGTRCNTPFTPSAAPCAAPCAHLLR